jgi:hypothetical protein
VTSDIAQKRNALSKAYPGYSWHEKVAGWSDEQVIAVYLRFQRDGWPKIEPQINPNLKPENVKPPDPPDEAQISLF